MKNVGLPENRNIDNSYMRLKISAVDGQIPET
jgi:hypothetical protein